jgi:putative membrane protein
VNAPARHVGDAGLQPQRTELAWRRTALSLAAGSVAAGKVLEPVLGGGSWVLAGVGTGLAGVLAVVAHRRSRQEVAGGRLVATCACAALVLGLGALAFVVGAPLVR